MRLTKMLAVLPEEVSREELHPFHTFLEQLDRYRKIHSLGCLMERHELIQLPAIGTLGLSTLTSGVMVQGFTSLPPRSSIQTYPSFGVFDDAWVDFLENLEECGALDSSSELEVHEESSAYFAESYNSVACLVRNTTSRQNSPLLLDIVRGGNHPVWICPEQFHGITSIVVAHSGDERLLPTLAVGQQLASAWHTKLEVVVAGQNAQDLQPRVTAIERQLQQLLAKATITTHLGPVSDIAEVLPVDHLLVAGGSHRWEVSRWLFGSHTERLLHAARGPMLILPNNELLRKSTGTAFHLLS